MMFCLLLLWDLWGQCALAFPPESSGSGGASGAFSADAEFRHDDHRDEGCAQECAHDDRHSLVGVHLEAPGVLLEGQLGLAGGRGLHM